MSRECNKCVYHTSGECSQWECKGTVTVEDVRAKVIDEVINIVFEFVDDMYSYEMFKNEIKEQLNLTKY